MTTLVECWNKLDGNVGELSSWVATKDSAAPDGTSEISIEKLETQLNTLKTMFAEKQQLVAELEASGGGWSSASSASASGTAPGAASGAVCATAPAGPKASSSATSCCFSANMVFNVFSWVSSFSMEISLVPSGAALSLVATQELSSPTFPSNLFQHSTNVVILATHSLKVS